jgi:exodeoxyribonuclease-3
VREAYRRLIVQGWTDAIRKKHPKDRIYTFWKYWRNSFARDAGLRIDHLLLTPDIAKKLKAAGVDRAVRGKPHTSDHAPTWIELGAVAKKATPKAAKKESPKRHRKTS